MYINKKFNATNMRNEDKLSTASSKKLIKKRDLLKGATIGFGIVFLLVIAFFSYLLVTKGTKDFPFVILMPVFILPVMFLPLLVSLGIVNKEIKSRKNN